MILYLIIKIRRFTGIRKLSVLDDSFEPVVTLFIAAYNEKEFVEQKIRNSLELDYPREKLQM